MIPVILRKAEAEDGANPTETRTAITQKKIRSLMSSARKTQNDVTEISGGFGAEMKDAVENHHLHRKAFNVIKTADRMEPEKLADFLDCLDCLEHYLDISGLNDRAAKVQTMNFEADSEAGDDEEAKGGKEKKGGRGAKNKVKPFPAPKGTSEE